MKAEVRRKIFVISVGVLVVLAVAYGFLPKPVAVDVAQAKRGPLRITVEEEGRTRVKERFVVSAPVAGYLRRIDLKPGDHVAKGRPVARLEPLRSTVLDSRSRAEAEASEAAARAALDAAKEKARAAAADAEYSRDRAARSKQLAANGYISKDDLEQAQSDAKKTAAVLQAADAAVVAAQADLERAQAVLRYSAADSASPGGKTVTVRSPANGNVLKVVRESEGVAAAGEPLIEIGNPASLEVKVELLSADAIKVRKGTAVLFERWGGEKALEGNVRVVEPAGFTKVSSLGVEEQRVNVIVDITSPFELWQKLGDGYRMDATFVLWKGTDVLQIPASSLFRKGDRWALFLIENKHARMRFVEIGKRSGLSAEILQGVPEGATVIANPEDSVKDGVKVRMRK